MIYILYLITGLLAGVVGGLLGTGGCALIMPVIRFGFHFDPAIAVGTTLTAVVFTAGSGAIQHMRMKNVDKTTALQVGLCGIVGEERIEAIRRHQVEMPEIGTNSTELRQRVSASQSLRYRTPRAVEMYIDTHGLYSRENAECLR